VYHTFKQRESHNTYVKKRNLIMAQNGFDLIKGGDYEDSFLITREKPNIAELDHDQVKELLVGDNGISNISDYRDVVNIVETVGGKYSLRHLEGKSFYMQQKSIEW